MGCVVGDIAFQEDDAVSTAAEGLAEAAPKGGVAVPPGRADAETENHQLHVGRSPVWLRQSRRAPHSSAWTMVTDAGEISKRSRKSSEMPRKCATTERRGSPWLTMAMVSAGCSIRSLSTQRTRRAWVSNIISPPGTRVPLR